MPHLRMEVPEEWLQEEFVKRTGFDPRALLDHLVEVVAGLRMEIPAAAPGLEPTMVPLINLSNLKHAIIPVVHSGVAGDRSKGFIHLRFSAGNDKPGRTAAVRRQAGETLGNAIDAFVGDLPELGSATVQILDIDRERGYTTTAGRLKGPKQDGGTDGT